MKEKEIVIFYIGIITLQYIVKLLKNIIKQNRPIQSNTYGMPSTKSATLFFILSYLFINNKITTKNKILLIILSIIGISYKLYYKEHSLIQIIIGALIGIIYAYILSYLNN